ncbi:MAG: hypothetical protein M3253_01080 [Chloroflexota bacterium]|nr:hypothetical protein [Chloroflexota bacterium]
MRPTAAAGAAVMGQFIDASELVLGEPMNGTDDAPLTSQSIADVLSAWRAAERRLEELVAGSDEWRRLQAEIDALRGRHDALFQAAERREDGIV